MLIFLFRKEVIDIELGRTGQLHHLPIMDSYSVNRRTTDQFRRTYKRSSKPLITIEMDKSHRLRIGRSSRSPLETLPNDRATQIASA